MQYIYDKKWFWGLWEYWRYLVIEIFYETTSKWTKCFEYINLWAFDVVLPLFRDIGDYPFCVTCDYPIYVTTPSMWRPCLCDDPSVWWPHLCDDPIYVMTPSVWRPCHVALREVSSFEMVLGIFMADID